MIFALIATGALALLVVVGIAGQSLWSWVRHRPPYDWPPRTTGRAASVQRFEDRPPGQLSHDDRGFPNGVLTHFDTRFNEMACDALRYRLSSSSAPADAGERRRLEDLVRRLEQPAPGPTPEEKTAMDTWAAVSDSYVYDTGGGYQKFDREELRRQARLASDSWRARQDEWRKHNDEARHAFVDVMRELGS